MKHYRLVNYDEKLVAGDEFYNIRLKKWIKLDLNNVGFKNNGKLIIRREIINFTDK